MRHGTMVGWGWSDLRFRELRAKWQRDKRKECLIRMAVSSMKGFSKSCGLQAAQLIVTRTYSELATKPSQSILRMRIHIIYFHMYISLSLFPYPSGKLKSFRKY